MFENVTIKDFSDAWFFEKYDKLSKDDFDICYSEYIDYAGLYATEEFDIITQIYYLSNRINSVKLSVELQKQYMAEFGEPYQPAFKFLKRFGHTVVWNGDMEDFTKQLDRLIIKDARFKIELDMRQKQLIEDRKKKDHGEKQDLKQTRIQFIQMTNSLGKIGFNIDKNETTVEELAIMLKQQFEEQESLNMKYG